MSLKKNLFLIKLLRLIQYSPELEELDLHNNTIGNMSAKMILNALEFRQKSKIILNFLLSRYNKIKF